jgi:CheY-like chemotaxis protein
MRNNGPQQQRICGARGKQGDDVDFALASSFEPDTALVDIGSPGMNGYELAQRLRTLPEYRDLQLIAMTG